MESSCNHQGEWILTAKRCRTGGKALYGERLRGRKIYKRTMTQEETMEEVLDVCEEGGWPTCQMLLIGPGRMRKESWLVDLASWGTSTRVQQNSMTIDLRQNWRHQRLQVSRQLSQGFAAKGSWEMRWQLGDDEVSVQAFQRRRSAESLDADEIRRTTPMHHWEGKLLEWCTKKLLYFNTSFCQDNSCSVNFL